jgi:ribonuclease HII
MKNFDNSFLSKKIKLIAGTDEAGRGPLAGPVVAAAVIFDKNTFIDGVNDSKKLIENKRIELYPIIIEKCLSYGISILSNTAIDQMNILQASLHAMKSAVNKLHIKPDLILIDGNKSFAHEIPTITIVKGDSKSFAVAAASIIAKVTRDNIMKRLSQKYSQYFWEKNKGYPTKQHINAIKVFGATALHRKSFLNNILRDNLVMNFESEKEAV